MKNKLSLSINTTINSITAWVCVCREGGHCPLKAPSRRINTTVGKTRGSEKEKKKGNRKEMRERRESEEKEGEKKAEGKKRRNKGKKGRGK